MHKFHFNAKISSAEKVTDLSYPNGMCEIIEQNDQFVNIQKVNASLAEFDEDIHFYFKADKMGEPRFYY